MLSFLTTVAFRLSLQAAPFEVLYGRKCRTKLNWSETGVRQLFGPGVIISVIAQDVTTTLEFFIVVLMLVTSILVILRIPNSPILYLRVLNASQLILRIQL